MSAFVSKTSSTLRSCVPASLASVTLGAMVSIAATSSLNFTPVVDAMPPLFSTDLFKYWMSAEPFWDAAAKMLMYEPEYSAPAPIWFNAPVKALAASGTSMPAASANVMASFVTAARASFDLSS